MKRKLGCLVLALSLLLCACGDIGQGDPASPPPSKLPTASPTAQVSPPAVTGEPQFTQTDSFPMPFDGGLYVNGNGELVLTFEKALYDYDTMWLLLEENYPYLDRIEAEMGIDWRAVRDKYRVIMERTAGAGGGWLTQEKFIGIIDKCLYDFHYVGHLYVIDTGFWRKMSDDWVTFEEGSLIHTLGTLVRNPKSVQFYEAWEELDGRGASERSTDGGFAKGETVPPGMTLDMVEGIPYVKLSTFSDWTDDTYAALSQFFSTIKDQEHLIIDIQGNGGGSTNAWGKGIVSALAGKTVESNYLNCAKAGTLNLALDPRFTERRGDYMESPGVYEDDSWQEDFPYVQPEYVEGMDLFFKNTIRVEPSDTSINFQGKIWVLIDKECYSAAEGFTAFCKSTGFATLVGTETGGSGLTSQPYVMVLPYSGLAIYYEPYLGFNPDGSCNGIRGTQPDLTPEEGQSALDACLAAIHGEETN